MIFYHLFPDLMNLYGDYGNLTVLAGVTGAQVVRIHPGDHVDWDAADLFYMGPGTEPALHAALERLRPMAEGLKAARERDALMLFTGNSWLALGESLTTGDAETLEGLGLFPFTAAESWQRYTHDAIALDGGNIPAVGFQNRCDRVEGVTSPWFRMEMGEGNRPGDSGEGLCAGRLRATHLTGPLLVKNPHILREFYTLLGREAPAVPQMEHAWQTTLTALRARRD